MNVVDPGQYDAFTARAGFARLENFGLIETTGADRAEFLHNLCTNDIRRIAAGHGAETFFTNPQGKIVGLATIFAEDQSHWIATAPGQDESLIEHLSHYRIREQIEFNDRAITVAEVVLAGRRSDELLTSAFSIVTPSSLYEHRRVMLAGQSALICRVDWLGDPSFLLLWNAAGTGDVLRALETAGAIACGEPVFQAVRIENGWPLYGQDVTVANLPQEVARDKRAISFTKGCYIGQETVARIDALGRVNQYLTGLRALSDAPLSRGDALEREGKTVAHVTSATWSPRLRAPLALAYVRRGANEPGVRLTANGRDVEVVQLPLK